MIPMLQVQDLNIFVKRGKTQQRIVKNVSFAINEGECLGLVGESGSGKSLTAQTIACLENYPFEGIIKINGETIEHKTEKEKRRIRGKQIGLVFQDPQICLNPTMKIGSQIQEVNDYSLTKNEVINLMLQMGLSERWYGSYPHELSGGMCQRVMLAMALARKPELLIADEPTSSLDVSTQMQIIKLIKEIQINSRTGILLITHDFRIVERLCSRVIVMHAGQIVEEGTTQQILLTPQHEYTKNLLACRPRFRANI